MRFLKSMYIGEGIKNVGLVRWKLAHGAGMMDVYVLSVPEGGGQLECTHCSYLKQRLLRQHLGIVVGIAKGYEEAMELIVSITEEAVSDTGKADIKGYLLKKAPKEST